MGQALLKKGRLKLIHMHRAAAEDIFSGKKTALKKTGPLIKSG